MLRVILSASLLLPAVAILETGVRGDDIAARARKLHLSSIVIDTHDDTTQRFLDGDFDFGLPV